MQPSGTLDLSHDALELTLSVAGRLQLERWTRPSVQPWIEPSSPLFALVADGQTFDGRMPAASVRDVQLDRLSADATQVLISLAYANADLEVDLHFVLHAGTALVEQWITIRNTAARPLRIDRIDSFSVHLRGGSYDLLHFSSSWGAEFEGVRQILDDALVLESRSGRSSNGAHPFFVLSRGEEMLSGAVAWSGNWVIRFQPDGDGCAVSGGLHDWEFFVDLPPGSELEAPRTILALAAGDLDDVARQYHQIGRRSWYPHNETSRRLPVEWNHWWSYEDRDIDEGVFRSNVEEAARLGLDLCTLDAGWFGVSDANADWSQYRGDWDRVNRARFPSGIRALADVTHDRGLLFGLWCEIEGLGKSARLAAEHPELEAIREGAPLGYVCFGCPGAQEWALQTLERLTVEYACDWIKLDFNVDPGAGCDRTDHGHGRGDGLYAHYRGYYAMLSAFRARHPSVALENCSSGGLRIDLGILRQTHLTFLSDADWPEHNLQVFWGASMMLAPDVCLHWSWSESMRPQARPAFDPRSPDLKRHQLDFYLRTALLGAAGVSLRLPNLPAAVRERIEHHTRLYHRHIRRFVRDAVLYRLTGQPLPGGRGDRWCGFQYSLDEEHLIFLFRLPGAELQRTVRLHDLDASSVYTITWLDDGRDERRRGHDLVREGLIVDWLEEEDSTMALLRPESSHA